MPLTVTRQCWVHLTAKRTVPVRRLRLRTFALRRKAGAGAAAARLAESRVAASAASSATRCVDMRRLLVRTILRRPADPGRHGAVICRAPEVFSIKIVGKSMPGGAE